MARRSTVKRAQRIVKIIEENYEEGVLRKSKAACVRNIISKEEGLCYRTVMRYQKLLSDGNIEEKERIPYSIPFIFD